MKNHKPSVRYPPADNINAVPKYHALSWYSNDYFWVAKSNLNTSLALDLLINASLRALGVDTSSL
jgi:hypothetical protein